MNSEKYSVSDSVLGTKEFWDSRYELEIKNFEENGDEGEIWFGKNAENRILLYINQLELDKDIQFIDIGCGNGSLLRRLQDRGYKNLTGVDYSSSAIELSKRLSDNGNDNNNEIVFKVDDMLSDNHDSELIHKFNIILDKGTWDAICLSGDRGERLKCYKKNIDTFFTNDSSKVQLFIIVSCNFTKEELIELFVDDNLQFESDLPPSKTFSFGGKSGQTSTGVVFKKKTK
uniref:Protein-lysine N-methyltransferase n=1 Tax=Strongyloides venezuelensis TaxID=75913 RepID=A0A0K0F7L2_STRVS